jgi:predicted O-linked N-acetylglucosamine transferase (SPINDLY family)
MLLDAKQPKADSLSSTTSRFPDKLRLGFIGPLFAFGPVSDFMTGPLMELSQDPQSPFEIFCFHPHHQIDSRMRRALVDPLKKAGVSIEFFEPYAVEETVKQIANHRLSILVDCSGHFSGGFTLPILARRPAEVIFTYLAYPNVLGVGDYRITSRLTDAKETRLAHDTTERLLRLEGTFLCYKSLRLSEFPPMVEAPPVAWVGSEKFAFACTNNPDKITLAYLQSVKQLLDIYPQATMHFKHIRFKKIQTLCATAGIDPQRYQISEGPAEFSDHLRCYNEIDLCLDTFPYSGTTTTFEAGLMGVPTLTLSDAEVHAANVTTMIHEVTQQTGLGPLKPRDDLVAYSRQDWLKKAVSFLTNDKLFAYRTYLRAQIVSSDLGNSEKFAKNFGKILIRGYREKTARKRRV